MANGLKDWCGLTIESYLTGRLVEILSSDTDHYYAIPLPKVGTEWVVVDSLHGILACRPKNHANDREASLITLRLDSEGKGFKFKENL